MKINRLTNILKQKLFENGTNSSDMEVVNWEMVIRELVIRKLVIGKFVDYY